MQKRLTKMALPVLLVLGATAGVLALLSGDAASVPADQRTAAEFLQVPVSEVTRLPREPRLYAPRGARQSLWRCEEQGAQDRALVGVDVDLGFVHWVSWAECPARTGPAVASPPRADRARALDAGVAFLRKHPAVWQESDALAGEDVRDYRPRPVLEFEWRGSGPEEFSHRVYVQVSLTTYDVVDYEAVVSPADPPAATAVQLDATQAAAIVEGKAMTVWQGMIRPIKARVYKLSTSSQFAAPGHPVYLVDVIGTRQGPPGEMGSQRVVCGVDATTGEILQEFLHTSAPVAGSAPPLVSADAALERARAALPADLTSPRLTLGELTWETPVAPAGTRVYPVRVSGERPSATNAEERVAWAMTWAVDAADGRIYGLGDRPLPDLTAAP